MDSSASHCLCWGNQSMKSLRNFSLSKFLKGHSVWFCVCVIEYFMRSCWFNSIINSKLTAEGSWVLQYHKWKFVMRCFEEGGSAGGFQDAGGTFYLFLYHVPSNLHFHTNYKRSLGREKRVQLCDPHKHEPFSNGKANPYNFTKQRITRVRLFRVSVIFWRCLVHGLPKRLSCSW